MTKINWLVAVPWLFAIFGCDNSAGPSGPADITEYANHYELLYVYQNEIHRISSSGENYRQITDNDFYDHEAIWSPDGQQIAFVSDRTGDLEVFVMNEDGSSPVRLTQNAEASQSPHFSPDGQRILYRSGSMLYVINVDGTNNRMLSASNWSIQNRNAWSPDGQSVVFEDQLDIYKINIDGSNKVRLTRDDAAEHSPSWSPDGSNIAFVSDRDGNLEIYVMNSDGSGQTNLSKHSGWDNYPVWSPDGTRLLFVSDRDGDKDIYVINADGSDVRNLSRDTYDSAYLPTWSPDQTRIAYAADTEEDGVNETLFILDVESGKKFNLATGWTSPVWH